MADHESHVSPRLQAAVSFAADIAHNVGIRANLCVCFEIVLTPHSQDESLCFQFHFVHSTNVELLELLDRVVSQLFPLPAHAILSVFQDDAALCEFVAKCIGASEVPPAAGFLALVYG